MTKKLSAASRERSSPCTTTASGTPESAGVSNCEHGGSPSACEPQTVTFHISFTYQGDVSKLGLVETPLGNVDNFLSSKY
jgi:hypothetical protein